jgi:hypothetical protein
MKNDIKQLELVIAEMKKAQIEHPKATIYYDGEDNEIRITYPLPRDFYKLYPYKLNKQR